ncbi:MAG TPA: MgtC/SapB family protein [Acetobacteraceae bacterium]
MQALWDSAFAHSFRVFALAFVLGLAIGLERQWRQRTAGLRTNVLVAVGAAAFSDLGMRLLSCSLSRTDARFAYRQQPEQVSFWLVPKAGDRT